MRPSLIALLVVLGATGPAFAQKTNPTSPAPMPQSSDPFMLEMDMDKDGSLSRTEAQQARANVFDKLDADHDGRLTRAERHEAGVHLGVRTDLGASSVVTRTAFMGRPYLLFDRADTNNDGLISSGELASARARRIAEEDMY